MNQNLQIALEHFEKVARYSAFDRLFKQLFDARVSMRLDRLTTRLHKMQKEKKISTWIDTTSEDWAEKLARSIIDRWESLHRTVVR